MRFRTVGPSFLVLLLFAATGLADYNTTSPAVPTLTPQPRRLARISRFFSFRSIAAQVDNQVIANLLVDAPTHANGLPLTVAGGDVARCEARVCQVPFTVRVADAQGPITLSLAVANPHGELSEVEHVECSTGECSLSLILERGQNTISLGVLDGLAQATGYTTLRVNATRSVADRGKAEWF